LVVDGLVGSRLPIVETNTSADQVSVPTPLPSQFRLTPKPHACAAAVFRDEFYAREF
jgi:hypothetical protein